MAISATDNNLCYSSHNDATIGLKTIDQLKIGETTTEIRDLLFATNTKYRKVFNKDLTGGYNGYYGPHTCNLNWASSQRPEVRKIPIANYDHELKGVLQEVCDNLTAQGVLKVPQDHGIIV